MTENDNRIHTIENAEFTMQYLRFGTGKKPMVILPGLSVQSVMPAAPLIEKQYEIFREDFTVYLFDRRAEVPPVYSVYDMANDTAKTMQTLGLHDVCLFGASQGGMMAMMIAAVHPELVGRLAVGSSACSVKGNRSAVISEWITLARKGNAEKLYLAFGEKLYPPTVYAASARMLKQMARTVTENDLKRFVILAEGLHSFDMTDMLRDIRCPMLALGDTHDHVLGALTVQEMAEQFKGNPQFETYVTQGFGHAAYDTDPDYPERLYRFFTTD